MINLRLFFVAGCLAMLFACSTVYYNFWETLGQEKRDILKSNLIAAKEEQGDVQEEFKSTLEKIRATYNFTGPKELENYYDEISADLADSKEEAGELKTRIRRVEQIGDDLFAEWKSEAEQIGDKALRRDSLAKREQSLKKFNTMLVSLTTAEKSLDPVLSRLNDHVLYIKHQLNAKALGAFQVETNSIKSGVAKLIGDLEKSTKATNDFISHIQ